MPALCPSRRRSLLLVLPPRVPWCVPCRLSYRTTRAGVFDLIVKCPAQTDSGLWRSVNDAAADRRGTGPDPVVDPGRDRDQLTPPGGVRGDAPADGLTGGASPQLRTIGSVERIDVPGQIGPEYEPAG